MIKFDVLEFGVYCEGEHIADFDNLDHAKYFAHNMAINKESDVVVISNYGGEVVTEFVVKFRMEVVEVEP
jgi:hypothetical protein